MKKKISEMTRNEFLTYERKHKTDEISDFALFCRRVKGFSFIHKKWRQRIYKWELYAMGCDAWGLINNQYEEIISFQRSQNELINETKVKMIITQLREKFII